MSLTRIILFALVVAAPSLASAQTYEQASALLGASCGAEIDNFCRGVNLDTVRMKECLRKNVDTLSPKCQADYPRAIAAIEARVLARTNLLKLCNWEMNHICGDVRQDQAKGLQCLLDATRKVTPNCGKAVAAAGYR